MDVFKALATEVFDEKLRVFLKRRKAEIEYFQHGPNWWKSHNDIIPDGELSKFGIMTWDDRRITFILSVEDPIKITITTWSLEESKIESRPPIDISNPGSNVVETIKKHIRDFV